MTPEERFLIKVIKTENCWNWIGGFSRGYGQFFNGKKAVGAYVAVNGANEVSNQVQAPSNVSNEKIMGMSKPLFYAVVAVGLILIVYALTRPKATS